MAHFLTKARNGRANALKSLSENRLVGTIATTPDGRRHSRPSQKAQAPMFMSVRGQKAPVAALTETAARIKAEKSFFASAMAHEMPNALVH